ncbi:Respiratory supercomplex factor 2, mitochondrial [Grifola frondosa]|uniref:Respiratory supercomplex factor 2, mitochondrial n=1 Tax=Grifola frondosa TaxID=5627 RepID=A0A1C7MGH0_GRIFR|nr:Respiratory supercomplex factor 2, mitochondrial [Grifola frondosa]
MKLATEEELAGHHAATVRGAVEGVVAGFAISLPASWYANRRWAYYRKLPIHLKALGVIMVVAPLYAIQAERRGVEFDKSTWTGAGKALLEKEEVRERKRLNMLQGSEKIREWAARNQYKVILGSWALSMGIAGAIVMGNRHQSTAQKVVQARMWAQGLTIGVLIGAGVLTHSQRVLQREADHSWVGILEEQQKEQKQLDQKQQLLLRAVPSQPLPSS